MNATVSAPGPTQDVRPVRRALVSVYDKTGLEDLGRALTEWVPQRQILSYGVRFAALTHLGDRVRCSGKVVEKLEHAGRPCVRVQISATKATGEITLAGEALVALN